MFWLLGLFIFVGPIHSLENCNRIVFLRPFFNKTFESRTFLKQMGWDTYKKFEILNPCNVDTKKVIIGLEQWKEKLDGWIWRSWKEGDSFRNLNWKNMHKKVDDTFTKLEQLVSLLADERPKEEALKMLRKPESLNLLSLEDFGRLPKEDKRSIVDGLVCSNTRKKTEYWIDSLNNLTPMDQTQSEKLKMILMKKLHDFDFKDKEQISTLLTRIKTFLRVNLYILTNIYSAIDKLQHGELPRLEQFLSNTLKEMKWSGLLKIKMDSCRRFQHQISDMTSTIHNEIAILVKNLIITNNQTHKLDFDKILKFIEDNLDLEIVVGQAVASLLYPVNWLLHMIENPDAYDKTKPVPGIFEYQFLRDNKYFLRDIFGLTKLGNVMVNSMIVRFILITAGGSYFGII